MKIFRSVSSCLRAAVSRPSVVDGRIVILIILLGYFLLFSAFEVSEGWDKAWERFGVPSMFPYREGQQAFADLRSLLSGFECKRLGFDVQLNNPCDPWNRPFAYPAGWLVLTPLGLDQSHAIFLGVVLALLFFISTFLIIGKLNFYEALIYSLILCSPTVMWIVERANIDIVIFLFLSVASILISRSQSLFFRSIGYLTVLLSAFLKLFPIFGLSIILKEKKIE